MDQDGGAQGRNASDIGVFGLQLNRLQLLEGGGSWTMHPDIRQASYRVVRTDVAGDEFVVLLRLGAGARLGATEARGMLEAYVLSGSVEIGGTPLPEGHTATIRATTGTSAVPVMLAHEACTLLVRGEGLEVLPS